MIPCLDVDAGRVVKGVNFVDLRDAGDPVELAAAYDAAGADELTFLDITASSDDRATMLDVVRRTAETVFIPLTVGGGVRTVADVDTLLRAGADKVGVNTAAIARPELIAEIAERFGSQVLVLVAGRPRAAARPPAPSGFEVTTHGGRRGTGIDAVEWAARGRRARAPGRSCSTRWTRDGTKAGFDLRADPRGAGGGDIPVIASGGAGALARLPAGGRGRRGRGARGERLPLRRAGDRRGQGRAARPAGDPVR